MVPTSSASSIDTFGFPTTLVSFTGEALGTVAEHNFLNAGDATSASSRVLFLGVSLRAGEGVAFLETTAFFTGLVRPLPKSLLDVDEGDLVTLMSNAPSARLLVGVAALMLGNLI